MLKSATKKTVKHYVFQCNANKHTGLGHLTRCLNIAKAIKQLQKDSMIIFNGEYLPFAKFLLLEESIITDNKTNLQAYENCTLILDDYQVTQADINLLRAQVATFIKIDDFNQHNLSKLDLVINFRLHAEQENYACAKTCLGLSYFPFKAQLIDIRNKNYNINKTSFNKIYVFIGGNDPHNTGFNLIHLLDSLVSDKQLFLIDNSYLVKHSVNLKQNTLTYLPLTSSIDHYYQHADFFITGGGLSKYEVAFCGIANAAISQNEGQAVDTIILAEAHLTHDLGLTEQLLNTSNKDLAAKLNNILSLEANKLFYQNSHRLFCNDSATTLATQIIRA